TEQPSASSSPLPENHRVRRQSIQCGNGVVTIANGEISCVG
ncbi:unnamed protein product, partial [Adineta ricciae]